jgi:hypothetical protein
MAENPGFRTRYPASAVVFVVGAILAGVVEITVMAVLVMAFPPLIPAFFAAAVGHGCLLNSALEYARSHARLEPLPRAETRGVTPPTHGAVHQPA